MKSTEHLDSAREHILRKHRIGPEARLSSGMEAEVYAYGSDSVLKLYAGSAYHADLLTLQSFYNTLDRQLVPYALPRIDTVTEESGILVAVEQRLAGSQLSSLLPALAPDQLDLIMGRYLDAALALARLQAPPGFDRYKLFDHERLSLRADGDWHHFLARYLSHKLIHVSPYLSRDVARFAAKLDYLRALLGLPYDGEYRLIHGDFFPGNLLISASQQITALLDFGLLTMYGDPLFDLATGWVFFDMYDQLRSNARERYLALLLERLGEDVRGRLYRYVLIYSILSANTYSSQCCDGHYQWCVANLNDQRYWDAVE